MKELEKLKEIYLANDVDDEDYQDNLDKITEWEKELFENENLISWQEHEVSKEILKKAKETYVEIAIRLANDRKIEEKERMSLWAKQDAMLWILQFSSDEPKNIIKQIQSDIKKALDI